MWGSDTKTVDIVVVPYPDGVEDSKVEEMGVYPNPFTDNVNLSFAKEGGYTIEIVAIDGKLIESKAVLVSTNEIVRVDVNGDAGQNSPATFTAADYYAKASVQEPVEFSGADADRDRFYILVEFDGKVRVQPDSQEEEFLRSHKPTRD